MKEIKLKFKKNFKKSSSVLIGFDLTDALISKLKKDKIGKRYCVITDEKVFKLYAESFVKSLKKNGFSVDVIVLPTGENQKKLVTIENLANKMVEKKFNRKDAIISFGGGVVGDISGFLASIYMRGMPYIQIPTTLLAIVDASVGGKTGVNLKSGKNLLGTFHQPKYTVIDIKYIEKLPEKHIRNGLSEIIKCSVIGSLPLFKFIEQNYKKILSFDKEPVLKIVEDALAVKIKFVEEDEEDKGSRMKLNYGHTFGHLLENLSCYTLLHGYAVSIGMVLANKIAVKKKLLSSADAERIKKLLKDVGLPTTTMQKVQFKDLVVDKKMEDGYVNIILPKKIGEAVILREKL